MISRSIASQMERSSWIRQMFEIGIRLRRERGAGNVFDFSLCNPDVEPPDAVLAILEQRSRDGAFFQVEQVDESLGELSRQLGQQGSPVVRGHLVQDEFRLVLGERAQNALLGIQVEIRKRVGSPLGLNQPQDLDAFFPR